MQLFPWFLHREKILDLGKLNPRFELRIYGMEFSTNCNHRNYQASYSLALDAEEMVHCSRRSEPLSNLRHSIRSIMRCCITLAYLEPQ